MSEGSLTDAEFAAKLGETTHEAGCTYGGFSCGYWLIVPGCPEEHWEEHFAMNEVCPCGETFPGAGGGKAKVAIRREDYEDADVLKREGAPADG